jgi:hypothetical protein
VRERATGAVRQLVDIGACCLGKIFVCTVGNASAAKRMHAAPGQEPEGAIPSTPLVTNYVCMCSVVGTRAATYEGVARPAFMLPSPNIIANKAWYVLKINAHTVTRKAPDGSAIEMARLIPNDFYWVAVCPCAPLSLRLRVAVDIFDLVPSSTRILNCPCNMLSRIRTDRHLKRAKLHPTRSFPTCWNGGMLALLPPLPARARARVLLGVFQILLRISVRAPGAVTVLGLYCRVFRTS